MNCSKCHTSLNSYEEEFLNGLCTICSKINPDENEELYYIQDARQYVGNAMIWWGANRSGYTCDLAHAGLYTKEEAEKICSCRKTEIAWKKSYIDQHAIKIADRQYLSDKHSFFKDKGH